MKYIVGSLIIGFGALFLLIVVLNASGVKSPFDSLQALGIAWGISALVCYPLARKIVR